MLTFVNNFVRDEEGATMIEYGLMVALIAVVCIAVIGTLGGNLSEMFEAVGEKVPTEIAE
jgi:pilus assembly protein Flp/PilA